MKVPKFLASAFLFSLAVSGLLAKGARAQGLASVNGTVTDPTGAAVSGASLRLLDTRTGTTFSTQTASDGGYRFVDVPPGPGYSLTVTRDGFQTYVLTGFYLPVATQTTKDVQLALGAISQSVEVVADTGSVSLDTTDATLGTNLDMHAVASLPTELRDDPSSLLRIQAGVTTAQYTGNLHASNIDPTGSRDGSVAGARADQNNIYVDGIDASDQIIGASFSTEAAIPVDAIQEFSTQVAEPTAAYGGRSGAQTLITTKSGTNDWHGSAFEYNRNAATEANTYFNKQSGVPRLALVRNQFGANFGGPVLKDKLFFFFEYDHRRDASAISETQFVPFPHVQKGEIAYINNSLDGAGPSGSSGCAGARLTASDVSTACVTIAPASEVTGLDPCSTASNCANAPGFVSGGPAPVLLNLFKNRYPAPNDYSLGDGLNIAGLLFNGPAPLVENSYLTRIDYNLAPNNKLFGRFNVRNEKKANTTSASELPIQFPGDPLTAQLTIRDRAWAIGDTWTINPNTVNQFTIGETRQNHQEPVNAPQPGGLYELSFFGAFEGSTFATPYDRQSSQGDISPNPTVRDDVTYTHGTHTIQFGAQFNPAKVRSSLVNDLNFIQEGLGGAITGLDSTLRPANISSDTNAQSNWDNFFLGDLGLIWNFQDSINYTGAGVALPPGSSANRDWRINGFASYGQDSWRIRPDLTITAGLRYQYQETPYDVHGTEAQFFNTNVSQIVATRIANGLAGTSGPLATPLLTYQKAGVANGGKPLYSADKLDFSPRLGLAWNPSFTNGFLGKVLGDRKTVIRAAGNLLYDSTVIYAITNFEDQSNYLFDNTVGGEFNDGTSTLFALENDPRMNSVSSAPFPVVAPPFQNPLTVPALIFNDGIDPQLKTPYSITASFGFQRTLPGGFQLEGNYYGRFGRRLLLLADVSQAIDFTDPTSKETMSHAYTVLEEDSRQNNGAGVPDASVATQPFFEHQIGAALASAGLGTCASHYKTTCTLHVYDSQFTALQEGATGEIESSIRIPQNVGLTPQFFVDALMANKGFSSYNSLLLTLRKRLSNNLQFDLYYTFSHAIDNGSTPTNNDGNFESGVSAVMCDVTNNSACRGDSEFDIRHSITGDFVYDLPFGRGQKFAGSVGTLMNEAIGGWTIAGIPTWHTGFAFTANNTDIALYDTVSLAADTGEIFNGPKSAVKSSVHTDGSGNVQFFANEPAAQNAFSPVTGLQSGDRDTLHGPHFANLDLSVSKNFPLMNERYKLKLVAEAYNVFNHPNFGLPDTGVTSGSFGVIHGLVGEEPSRVMQFALRFDF